MTYEPDEQDELIGDAMAVGGPAFAEDLHYAAMEAAEAVCPWDGNGVEPVEYRRAWLGEARRLIAARRAELATRSGAGAADLRQADPDRGTDEVVSPCSRALGPLDPDGVS